MILFYMIFLLAGAAVFNKVEEKAEVKLLNRIFVRIYLYLVRTMRFKYKCSTRFYRT